MSRAYGSHLCGFNHLQRIKIRCYNMLRAYGSVKSLKMYKFRRNEIYCSNGF